MRRAGPLASIMARNTGLQEVGTKGVLIPACQWLWPPSPAEQERKQGQDIHFLSFPPSLRLGRELLSLSWVPGLQPQHLSQTSRCPACCGSSACSSGLCGQSQAVSGSQARSGCLGLILQMGKHEPLSSFPQVAWFFPHGLTSHTSPRTVRGGSQPQPTAHSRERQGGRVGWQGGSPGLRRPRHGQEGGREAESSHRASLLGDPRQLGVQAGSGSGHSRS